MVKPKAIHRCDECDEVLSTKRRFCDDTCEQTNLCKSMGTAKYRNRFVVVEFQAMVRAEAGTEPAGTVMAVVNGIVRPVHRLIGEVVCVTCGTVGPWTGGRGWQQMQTGHFCSRKDQSVLFHEWNTAIQCAGCNQPPGSPNEFRIWMTAIRTGDVVDMLETLARQPFAYKADELVTMRIDFKRRLKAAETKMKGTP